MWRGFAYVNVPESATWRTPVRIPLAFARVYAQHAAPHLKGSKEFEMATAPTRVNVMEYSGKQFLLDLDRKERAEFYNLLDEAPWEGATASGHWQVRDLCGHMIDVT